MKKNMLNLSLILTFVLIGIVIFWFLNPTVDNKDFDLMYRVSNCNKNFYDERKNNDTIYTFNNDIFINSNNYRLILHSLDYPNDKEKIIIVKEGIGKTREYRVANITYKDKFGKYSPIKIEIINDSIFIYQISDIPQNNLNLMYKGFRMN
jgi:hypothetical protein